MNDTKTAVWNAYENARANTHVSIYLRDASLLRVKCYDRVLARTWRGLQLPTSSCIVSECASPEAAHDHNSRVKLRF